MKKEQDKWVFAFFSSSLFCPKISNLSLASSVDKPSFVHLKFSKTSSIGMFSYNTIHKSIQIKEPGKEPGMWKKNKKLNFRKKNLKHKKTTRSTASFRMASKTSFFSPIIPENPWEITRNTYKSKYALGNASYLRRPTNCFTSKTHQRCEKGVTDQKEEPLTPNFCGSR